MVVLPSGWLEIISTQSGKEARVPRFFQRLLIYTLAGFILSSDTHMIVVVVVEVVGGIASLPLPPAPCEAMALPLPGPLTLPAC